jgi:UDP-2,4-diacetamido-2,4,6-trideoxy-beta-L-altropyranose hydrolase
MIIFRADGNAKIGMGHLMRCLTVAEAVRTGFGEPIRFLCSDEESAGLAKERGFEAAALQGDYRQLERELPRWRQWIKGSSNTILVDSYYVTDAYLEGLKPYGTVYLMDDLQNHAYPVDGVINYNLFADRAVYERLYTGRSVKFCLGGNYVPLREQFAGVNYGVRDGVRDVLITTGGGDEHNIAGAILDRIYREDMVYHVLVGRFSPHFESWQKRAGAEKNIRIHFDVKDMAELMCQCDLAVSAGGSTLYELAAVGVPFISFSYAENQEALVEYMGRHEVAGCVGAWHKDARGTLDRLEKLFAELCEDSDLRRRYFERERGLIDGQGAGRVAKVLCHVHCGNVL